MAGLATRSFRRIGQRSRLKSRRVAARRRQDRVAAGIGLVPYLHEVASREIRVRLRVVSADELGTTGQGCVAPRGYTEASRESVGVGPSADDVSRLHELADVLLIGNGIVDLHEG